ncbi:MAG TPA: terminase family protein [Salinarimonas sp.]|nr:terminase family protein [Salinarimonas sp.]
MTKRPGPRAPDKRKLTAHVFSQAKAAVRAASPEGALKQAAALRATLFKQQLDFVDDPWRKKVVLCPRRAGKTWVFAVYLYVTALTKPGSASVYITMTRGVAKRNLWGILKKLNDIYRLGAKFHGTDLIATLPNGSTITLGGAETEADIDKYRGSPFDLIILDESKSFPAELINELVEEVLGPTLHDNFGTIVMGGTPGAILAGSFYEASGEKAFVIEDGRVTSRPYAEADLPRWKGMEFRWSWHQWTTAQNVAKPHIWQEILRDKEVNGWSDDDPRWLREYCGRWIADDTAFVFKYSEERNGWTPQRTEANPWGLPEGHEWRFIAGVDLGYDDPFSMQVFAYSETHKEMFHVWGDRQAELNAQEIAERIKKCEAMFGGFDALIGDSAGLGKMIFKTLTEVWGVVVEPAEKQGKRDYIELFNTELLSGRIHILKGSGLAEQMSRVQWDEAKRREDPAFPNDDCDAALYVIRYALHHYADPSRLAPKPGTIEYLKMIEEEEFEKAARDYKQNLHTDLYDSIDLDDPDYLQ